MMARNQMPEIVLNGPKFQNLDGRYSSLDISIPAGLAVSVIDDYTGSLYYSVGNYDGDHNNITWGEKKWCGYGRSPSICLVYEGETLYVIEVHCRNVASSLQYKIGKVNPQSMSIEWDDIPNEFLAYGKKPKICAAENGTVILIYESFLFNGILYRVATTTIQDGNISIAWGRKEVISSIKGVEPDISVCQDKLVAIFRNGKITQEISTIVGTLKESIVSWNRKISICGYGHNPSVSINAGNNIVAFYQVFGRRLHHTSGQLVNGKIVWSECSTSTFTLGEYPSVILTDDNKIVEMHKANFLHSMYQSEGKLEVAE